MTEYRETKAGMRLALQDATDGDLFVSSRPKAIIPNVWTKVDTNSWSGLGGRIPITLDTERIITVFCDSRWAIL